MLQTQSQSLLPFAAEDELYPGLQAQSELLRRSPVLEPGLWDEMRHGDGRLRESWREFVHWLPPPAADQTLAGDMDRRVAQVARQIRRDGITHNVFGEQGAAQRPWSLELLPLIIDPFDWALIEAGVVQRAALMQAMLADAYGPQHLLHEGLFPPALLLRHPGYLRSMLGVQPASGLRLHIVAFDLVRAPDGRWQVLSCRSQGPSGLGYVLHNRLVISRQFPDAFRELRVQHIATSYRRLLDSIERPARAVAGGAAPRVVLLTPGPYAETYFEHAYLARYLGLPLVEGGDLVVREQRLYLKTVEGLEPVHGMLRRLDDDWCDPLELRADSALGVPGLLQAVRAGHVVMANALGNGFLESPAIQGFLPGIARRLLGQELLLPALPTWWCGEAAAWHDVRAHLDDKIVRSTFPRHGRPSMIVRPDDVHIDDDPDAWTVTERVRFSRAPVWSDGTVLARPAMVRVFAIAEDAGRWHVLPGGMTRVAKADEISVSMQRGGSSLDTWVRTEGPVDSFSMLPSRLSVDDIAARRPPVPSRTAENLFWLGRYTERTEQMVRLARAVLLLIDTDEDATEPLREALSELAVRSGLAPWGAPTLNQAPHLFERALLGALADPAGTSIAFNLGALERASQALRERLSNEQWAVVRSMGAHFQALRGDEPGSLPQLAQVLVALDLLGVELAAVTGAQSDRMTRDHGWRFMTVGRLLERLIGMSFQLGAFVETGALGQSAGMELMLELFDSAITFRARYQRHEDLLALTDLLVLDSANPRSLAGVLRRLRTELRKLPGDDDFIDTLLQRLPADGAGVQLCDLRGATEAQVLSVLGEVCAKLRASGAGLADDLGHRFFAHASTGDELQRV
ncbi:MAG: circularly permuted type 2 ATP-grasp protein [Burkholderiaceae bacterium]|nr:circularly permuted type 2 ATP-grasp protein [Burkholderiaceae bacterium]